MKTEKNQKNQNGQNFPETVKYQARFFRKRLSLQLHFSTNSKPIGPDVPAVAMFLPE
jgi:hypothetical protein